MHFVCHGRLRRRALKLSPARSRTCTGARDKAAHRRRQFLSSNGCWYRSISNPGQVGFDFEAGKVVASRFLFAGGLPQIGGAEPKEVS